MGKFKEFNIESLIIDKLNSSLPLYFTLSNGTNALFYTNEFHGLSVLTFDNMGKELGKIKDLFPEARVLSFLVATRNEELFIYADLK